MSSQHPTPAQVAWDILAFSAPASGPFPRPVSYLAREDARAEAMRTPAGECECGTPIFADPGYCTLCALDAA